MKFSSTCVTIYRYKIGIFMKMSIYGKYQFRFAIIIMLLIREEKKCCIARAIYCKVFFLS